MRLSDQPSWATWLFPYRWYTDITAGPFTRRAVLGLVPMTPPAHKRIVWTLTASQHARKVGGGLLIGAFIIALTLPHTSLAPRVTAAGLGTFLIATVLHLLGCTCSIGGRIKKGDRWVRLIGVHPRFATAVRAQYRARRASAGMVAPPPVPRSNGTVTVPARTPVAIGIRPGHS